MEEVSERGLTLPELAAALEVWTDGDEPYVCFVHRRDAAGFSRRLAHPALSIYKTARIEPGTVLVWMRKDAPSELIQMSERVPTYQRLEG